MKTVEVWQACALSLNIEPDSMKFSKHGWMAEPTNEGPFFEAESFPDLPTKNKFGQRLRLVRGYLSDPRLFKLGAIVLGKPGHAQIRLSDFVKWALTVVELGDLPGPLVQSQRAHVAPASPAPLARAEAQEIAILDAIRATKFSPKAIPRPPRGMRGLKAELREKLTKNRKDIFSSVGTFDEAWQRLRDQGEIIDAG
jgi:hypothetical protein